MKSRANTPRSELRLTETSGLPRKASKADLKHQYRLTMEVSLVASLTLITVLFRAPMQNSSDFEYTTVEQEVVEMEEIKQTKQIEQPPPPPRPQVPVAVADEMVLDDQELDLDAGLDLDAPMDLPIPPPPAPVEEKQTVVEDEAEIFVVVEDMPEIIGGTARLYELIEYPEIARQAGMEGMVVVQVIIERDGRPTSPEIARSAGSVLDEAAVKAVMQLTFKPGQQRGKAVRVKYAIPVRFRLRDQNK